jgi:hypothetical protein
MKKPLRKRLKKNKSKKHRKNMELLIGCPIYKRNWIFPYWISCIESQGIDMSKVGFIFEASRDDEATLQMLLRYRENNKSIPVFEINFRDDLAHHEHAENSRMWTLSKYENMVSMRNSLLKRARELRPNYYYSLDSDILLTNPNTINFLVSHIKQGAGAVSTLMFMTPVSTMYPGVMNWMDETGDKAFRKEEYPLGTYFQSDIIMGAKMMSKEVYNNVDYKIHAQGEDLGWSHNAKKMGYELYCASYIYTPHIMNKIMLSEFLKSGDDRAKLYSAV